MIKQIVYKKDELMDLLDKEFKIQKVLTYDEYSDDYDEYGTQKSYMYYITKYDSIKDFKIYNACFFSSYYLTFENEDKIEFIARNVVNKKNLIPRIENNVFSIGFKMVGDYIIVNKNLLEWLEFNGITGEQLDKISIIYKKESIYEYNLNDVIFDKHGVVKGHLNENIKLKESDINKAISEISDKSIAQRISYILKEFADKEMF